MLMEHCNASLPGLTRTRMHAKRTCSGSPSHQRERGSGGCKSSQAKVPPACALGSAGNWGCHFTIACAFFSACGRSTARAFNLRCPRSCS
jgi:hypothetical protein